MSSAPDIAPGAPLAALAGDHGATTRRAHDRVGIAAGFVLIGVVLTAALLGPALAPHDPFDSVARPFRPPSLTHLFGTDDLGRDLLSATIHGARTSVLAGAVVAGMALLIGFVLGTTAGFVGGITDDLLMRVTEIVQTLPRFFMAIVVVALFGGTLFNVVLVLALTSWGGLARVARAEALSWREREFVRAARALGASPWRILLRHIVPNVIPPVAAMVALVFGSAVLTEAGMSYLGLGDANRVSWGYLLNNAQSHFERAWWLTVFPGCAIVITIVGVGLVADRLEHLAARRREGGGLADHIAAAR
jgi:peptide/nickel transport system permease protein